MDMWARVTVRSVAKDKLDATLAAFHNSMVPYVTSQPGNAGALVLFDRSSGNVLAISMWEDEASMNASAVRRPTSVTEAAGGQASEQSYEIFARK
jgi:heme-degrading monooxygenase HmoA